MSLGTDILAYHGAQSESFVRKVPCPELPTFDGHICVRRVSARELDAVVARDDDTNSRARYAVLFACDPAGHRLWGDHQAEPLGNNARMLFLIERINQAGREHNGLTDESRRLTEKNSVAGEASGSRDSSAAIAQPATGSTGNG